MKNKNTLHTELWIDRENVDRVSSFKFLGVHISEDLTWSLNTSHLIKKAQKCLFHLRTLKRNRLPQKLLINFYNCTIKYVLTYGCTVWYSSCTAAENKTFSGWLKQLSGLSALHSRTWATSTQAAYHSHPGHSLFSILPSGRLRTIRARTNRLKNSFFPRAVDSLLKHQHTHTTLIKTHIHSPDEQYKC